MNEQKDYTNAGFLFWIFYATYRDDKKVSPVVTQILDVRSHHSVAE